ncbi:MAG TPA: sugar ABC transporter permease [Candidatus Atribacteria bacterium]|jgi:multiple sugar transport system permease protein|nr:sugar ABC transporter permease [Candidatus Atribacteria bacterium]
MLVADEEEGHCMRLNLGESYWLMLLPALIVLAAITFPPFFYSIYLSVHDVDLTKPYLGRPFVGVNNFITLFQDSRALNSFLNTGILVGSMVAIEFVLGLLIALLIDTYFPKATWLITLIIIPMTFPRVVVGLVWRIMLNPLIGVVNYLLQFLGLGAVDWLADPTMAMVSIIAVDVWQWTAFIVLLLLAGFQTLPKEPFDAAKVDGASGMDVFRYITIPLLQPVIVVALVFRVIDALRTFDIVYIMTRGGPGTSTETVDIFAYYIGISEAGRISYAAAVSLVMLFVTIVLITIFLRFSEQWQEEMY